MKKVIAFLLLFATLFLSACTRYENVKPGEDENGFYCLYQENRYYQVPWDFFVRCGLNESDSYPEQTHSQIGSFYSFPFSSFYFSYTTESPLYIYTSNKTGYLKNNIYFREDYNYKTDIFKIEGTEDVICFGEDLIEFSRTGSIDKRKEYIRLFSSTHPSLYFGLGIVLDNGVWYAEANDLSLTFVLSENFIEILVRNQIITIN